jgi:hypothetical protein
MNDMTATIVAKSDQINAADLIGTSRTITIKEVRIKAGDDQPVTIIIEEDKKAFRPCKGVRRLLVRVWGPDASKYIGQSMTIYCDPTVTWAGKEEGGIRVSHMTGLNEKIVEFMRTSKAVTKPYEIRPLVAQVVQHPADHKHEAKPISAADYADWYERKVAACADTDALIALQTAQHAKLERLKAEDADLYERAVAAGNARADALREGV